MQRQAAPARRVQVVFSARTHGYISDDATGIDSALPAIELKKGENDIWRSEPLPEFSTFEGAPYMYRVTNEQGNVRYRTDLYSRCQFGRGDVNPQKQIWDGTLATLDGSKSCSVAVSQDTVAANLDDAGGRVTRDEFWRTEFITEALKLRNPLTAYRHHSRQS